MISSKKLLVCLISVSLFSLIGCEQGPAEKQGKKVDNTVQKIKDKVENKGPAQKAGEKIDEITGN
ncbi:hypothetical protein [Legionella gresilensis]|uniref:hypothetical protein n=1 Tax=Legionella gresilensis TaxID=91823 RepID=UPI001040EE68|nr:hypothetical protein [Legionella gresilensis]